MATPGHLIIYHILERGSTNLQLPLLLLCLAQATDSETGKLILILDFFKKIFQNFGLLPIFIFKISYVTTGMA